MRSPSSALVSSRLRSRRGEAIVAVLCGVAALAVGAAGYHLFAWSPLRDRRVAAAEKKLAEAESRYRSAAEALSIARQAAQQQQAGIAADTTRQTQAAQSMVAATGQALAAAPPDVRSDLHVATALQTNAVAAHALQSALGPLTPAQLAEINRLVATATAASETRRAQAAAELAHIQQQLAAEQQDKQRHQQLLRDSETKLAAAQKAAADAHTAVHDTRQQLLETATHRDHLGHLLDLHLFWLKLGLGLYLALTYGVPLVSRVFPGLRALSELAHALVSPVVHQEKAGMENLARDASAATDELLELISVRCPDALKEAHARAGAWITEHDGVRARFERMLRVAHRR